VEGIPDVATGVDQRLIGGAMAYTFLRAKNEPTGRSLVEEDKLDLARELLATAGAKLMLPVDHLVVREVKTGAESEVVGTIGADQIGVDIGPRTIEEYAKVIRGAKTVIWNGPMGIFELPPFD